MPEYVRLQFKLMEPVTPEHLALRVAEACTSYGALRPGESVRALGYDTEYTQEAIATALFEREEMVATMLRKGGGDG